MVVGKFFHFLNGVKIGMNNDKGVFYFSYSQKIFGLQFVFSRNTNGDVSLLTYKLSKEVNTNEDVDQTILYTTNCDEFDELTTFWEGIKELGAQPQEERQPTWDN